MQILTTDTIPSRVSWMSYEDYMVEKAWLEQREKELLVHNGLGWLLKFQADMQETSFKKDNGIT